MKTEQTNTNKHHIFLYPTHHHHLMGRLALHVHASATGPLQQLTRMVPPSRARKSGCCRHEETSPAQPPPTLCDGRLGPTKTAKHPGPGACQAFYIRAVRLTQHTAGPLCGEATFLKTIEQPSALKATDLRLAKLAVAIHSPTASEVFRRHNTAHKCHRLHLP